MLIQWYPSAKIGTLPECRAKNQKPVYSVVYTHSLVFHQVVCIHFMSIAIFTLCPFFLVMLAHGRKCSKLQKTCWKYKDMHKFQTIHFFLEMLEILLISNIMNIYLFWILFLALLAIVPLMIIKGRVDEVPNIQTSPKVKEKKKGWFN